MSSNTASFTSELLTLRLSFVDRKEAVANFCHITSDQYVLLIDINRYPVSS